MERLAKEVMAQPEVIERMKKVLEADSMFFQGQRRLIQFNTPSLNGNF